MTDIEKEIIEEHMATSLHTKAINKARHIIDEAEHDLLVLIALKRARNGNAERFPYRLTSKYKEIWFTAHITHNEAMREGKILRIRYFKSGDEFYATPLGLADGLKDRLAK